MLTGDNSGVAAEGQEFVASAYELALLTIDSIGLMQIKFVNARFFWQADILAKTRSLLGEAFKVPIAELSVEDGHIVSQ
jgi:hypothetical protein